jgi:hypothetical protein
MAGAGRAAKVDVGALPPNAFAPMTTPTTRNSPQITPKTPRGTSTRLSRPVPSVDGAAAPDGAGIWSAGMAEVVARAPNGDPPGTAASLPNGELAGAGAWAKAELDSDKLP